MFKTEPLQAVFLWLSTGFFDKLNWLPFCLSASFGKMILSHLKSRILYSSILQVKVYFKESSAFLITIIFRIQIR